MYADWVEVDLSSIHGRSVLQRFSEVSGKYVASTVVKELAKSVNIELNPTGLFPSPLTSDEEVQWAMQVVCYGLGLPFTTDYETIRDCVKLYSCWMGCLKSEPQPWIPLPVSEQPGRYFSEMMGHLYHLFVPRGDSENTTIMRQAKEAHYVLRCLQGLMMESRTDLQIQVWPDVLKFLLSINDSLLSIPFETDDITVQLCSRVLGVLFELWLRASGSGYFPSPSFWKTFRTLCRQWRHRVALIDQWAQVVLLLTRRLLIDAGGGDACRAILGDEQSVMIPDTTTSESVQQCWFRFFYLLGNPAEIPSSSVFDSSPKFREYVARFGPQHGIFEPTEHPCLNQLPFCFFRAMCAVSSLVGIFLGEEVDCSFPGPSKLIKDWSVLLSNPSSAQHPPQAPTQPSAPSLVRTALGIPSVGGKKETKEAGKAANLKSWNLNQLPASALVYGCLKAKTLVVSNDTSWNPCQMNISQILDLLGEWLYSAATITVHPSTTPEDTLSLVSTGSQSETESSGKSQGTASEGGIHHFLGVSGIQAGKAEAVGALCKIFCARRSDTDLSELHTVKFYAVLLECLVQKDNVTLSSLIFHGVNLYRLDLKGMELLIPNFLDAIEHVIIDSEKSKMHPSISEKELRRACLQHYSAIVSLPTFYGASAINDLNRNTEQHTFIGMRPKLLRTLIYVLRHETDPVNLQLALSLSSVFCLESWQWELRVKSPPSEGYCLQAVRSVISVICEQLSSRWPGENTVCVSALECLSTLTALCETHVCEDESLYVQLVSSLCHFIETQLSRPPPYHSRDLHSTVVSALQCVQTWITAMPTLMKSEECLNRVTETIELGISGSKGQPISAGAQKKPASQRVHDAAEQLLYCLFCRVGSDFKSLAEVEDETWVLNGLKKKNAEASRQEFQYYLLDNSAIVGLLELTSAGVEENDFPHMSMVLRSPYYGIRNLKFTLRPRAPNKERPPDWVQRPEGIDPPKCPRPTPAYYPPELEKIPKCKAEFSIPPLRVSPEAEKLRPLIREAVQKEKWNQAKTDMGQIKDIKPPAPTVDCNIGRILLGDLGYLDPDRIGHDCILLNSELDEFCEELSKSVDACPCRTLQTVHIFFVGKGQSGSSEILDNGALIDKTSAGFCRFLSQLGSGLEVKSHRHWTGHWSTAFADSNIDVIEEEAEATSYCLDGVKHFLYWSTPAVEIAFLVPTRNSQKVLVQPKSRSTPPLENVVLQVSAFEDPARPVCSDRISSRRRSQSLSPEDQCEKFGFEDSPKTDVFSPPLANGTRSSSSSHLEASSDSPENGMSLFNPLLMDKKSPKRFGAGIFRLFGQKKSAPSILAEQWRNSPPPIIVVNESPIEDGSVHEIPNGVETVGMNLGSAPSALTAPVRPPRSKSISHEAELSSSKIGNFSDSWSKSSRRPPVYQDYRIVVAWLEHLEDHLSFPLKELLPATDTGEEGVRGTSETTFLIFLHRMRSGLCRVLLRGPWGKLGFCGPLLDGSVVSEQLLSFLIRQTVVNIGRRRSLEQEGYVLPHVRRKQRIQDFGNRFRRKLNSTDFLAEILMA